MAISARGFFLPGGTAVLMSSGSSDSSSPVNADSANHANNAALLSRNTQASGKTTIVTTVPRGNVKKRLIIHALHAAAVLAFIILRSTTALSLPSHPNRAEIEKLDSVSCEDGFSFAVTSDSHQSTTVFELIIDEVIARKLDFAITTGDFTNDGKPEEYEQFVAQIERAGVPWFAVPGNHEYRNPDGHTSVDGPKRFKDIFGKQDFYFDYCGWRFVALDVVALDTLLPAQLARLDKALAGHEGRSAVFMHYPPAILEKWAEGIYKSTAQRFMEILKKNDAAYSFAGHIHIFDENLIGPTTYIITGGAGGGMDSYLKPENYYSPAGLAFHHFTLVTIDKNGNATHEVIRIDTKE